MASSPEQKELKDWKKIAFELKKALVCARGDLRGFSGPPEQFDSWGKGTKALERYQKLANPK